MKTTKWLFGIFVFFIFNVGSAQEVILDYSFGTRGFVQPSYGGLESEDLFMKVQPDGKIVTLETVSNHGADPQYYLRRYLSNGSPDATFGVAGKVISSFVGLTARIKGVQLHNGKIIIAGSFIGAGSGAGDFIARYKANGVLDSTFGVGGVAMMVGMSVYSFALQSDGKMLVAYSTGGANRLSRYNLNATLDTGFGVSGSVSVPSQGIVKVQADGKILFGSGNADFVFMRFLTNGTIDTTFGIAGTATIDINTTDHLTFVKTMSGGKILFIGDSFNLIRLLPNGTLDTSFSTTGFVELPISPTALDIQNDGKIIIAGWFPMSSSPNVLALTRYLPNGNVDMSFGSFGLVTNAIGGATRVFGADMRVLSSGKIVVAGVLCEALLSCHPHSYIVRYKTVTPAP